MPVKMNQPIKSKEVKEHPRLRIVHQLFRTAGVIFSVFILTYPLRNIFIHSLGTGFLQVEFLPFWDLLGRVMIQAAAVGLILAGFLPLSPRWSVFWERIPRLFLYIILFLLWTVVFFVSFNVIGYYFLFFSGTIKSTFPVPLDLILVIVIVFNIWRIHNEFGNGERIEGDAPPLNLLKNHGVCLVLLVIFFPLLMIMIYGATDYTGILGSGQRSPLPSVDCIVVYGAKVNHDGTPSGALAERVNRAVELFHQGYGRYLLMTGGANHNGKSETQSMKDFAISQGVPADRIIVDESGFKTYYSILNVKKIMENRGWHQSLSVSHNYHLLRIKLAADHAGLNTYTVPVKNSGLISYEFWSVIREIPALYYYYFFFFMGRNSDA